jgi:enoyl-[acyl-carrier protein] reductase II
MPFRNRVTELLGIEIPIVQAPMFFLNRSHGPGLRALRTARSEQLEQATHNVMSEFGDRAKVLKLYFGGDLEAALALSGQVAGRIDAVRPVAEVIRETAADCLALLERLAARYPRAAVQP